MDDRIISEMALSESIHELEKQMLSQKRHELEKQMFSQKRNDSGDLISRKWLMKCVEEGWIQFDTQKDENRFIHLVRDIAPPAEQLYYCSNCGSPMEVFD